jgi:DNA polymerase I-like protein with 3'-5' exonuclease and polymerase domains
MKFIAIDTETHLIVDNNVPAPVCLTAFLLDDQGQSESFIARFDQTLYAWLKHVFADTNKTIIMHNAAFDLSVICATYPSLYPQVFKALKDGRVHDTGIIEKLHKIAHGGEGVGVMDVNGTKVAKLSLAGLVYKYFMIDIASSKQADSVRYQYDSFRNQSLDIWSQEAKIYAVYDAMYTMLVYQVQMQQIPQDEIVGHAKQVSYDFALRLTGSHGICVDPSKVSSVKKSLEDAIKEQEQPLLELGILKVEKNEIKENKTIIKARVQQAYESMKKEIKKTDSGAISMDKSALEESEDPELLSLLEYREVTKLLSTYIDSVEMVNLPLMDGRLRCDYEVLQATGRTSSRDPNLQNLPRREGIRDCFVPSKGFVFVACDYDAAELRTLAQCHYSMTGNESPLLSMYKKDSGFDPHTWFACKMLNISYEEGMTRKSQGDKEIKKQRQRAKACNFGFPGGMGASSFMAYAKGYGVTLTKDEAQDLKNQWFDAWQLWDWLDHAQDAQEEGFVIIPQSHRKRGRVSFTQACNTPFQGLASDGAKEALFNVALECFADSDSPLYNSRPVVFIHDEIIIESPENNAQAAARRLQQIMIASMRSFCPDTPIEASPTLMRSWSKNAESKLDANGNFTIWE